MPKTRKQKISDWWGRNKDQFWLTVIGNIFFAGVVGASLVGVQIIDNKKSLEQQKVFFIELSDENKDFQSNLSVNLLNYEKNINDSVSESEVTNTHVWNWSRACEVLDYYNRGEKGIPLQKYDVDGYKRNIKFMKDKYKDDPPDKRRFEAINYILSNIDASDMNYDIYLHSGTYVSDELINIFIETARNILNTYKNKNYFGLEDCPIHN